MGEEQQFCLRWNNFQANITSQFESLRDEEDFVDVTLACEGQQLKAHKVVLSACSPYFKELFKSNPCKHPIIFMRDVEFKHLQCLLEFMYAGEVNVAQAQLPAFLRTAESLQIRGLTEAPRQKSESKQQPPPPSPLQTPSHGSPVQAHSTPKPPPRQTRSAISPPTLVPRPSLCLEGKQNSTANSHIDEGITPPAKRIKSDSECEAGLIISGSQDDMEHSRSSMPAERLDVEGKSNSPEVIQPKLELPEYNSDGESRADSMGGSTSLLGLDNSMDMHSSFAALQSGVDVIPGTSSQPSVGDLSLDSSQGMESTLPVIKTEPECPPTRRRRISLQSFSSNMLVNDGTVDDSSSAMVVIGEGVQIAERMLRLINPLDYRKMTRSLATILFTPTELATRSVTGQKSCKNKGEIIKPALNKRKVVAIISYVTKRFPNASPTKIKQVLAYKCKEAACALRTRVARSYRV